MTLGSDGAGRIARSASGVEGIAPGDEVVIDPALAWGDDEHAAAEEFDILGSPTQGTFAEQVVVPASNVHPKPAGLSWEEAAAFPLAGLTAWRATVTCAGAAPGPAPADHRRRLGRLDVLPADRARARRRGLGHVGQRRQDRALRRARAAGGFRYDDPEWPQQVRAATGGAGVHAVIDSFGGEGWAKALAALARGGAIVNYGDTGGETRPSRSWSSTGTGAR